MQTGAHTWPRHLPILCLEDDPHFSRMLRRAYRSHAIDVVDSAEVSRARIRDRAYGAWLLDIRVPDGSGLDVLEWARGRGDQTPALVMTGLTDATLADRAEDLGAEFFCKPCSKAQLDDFIERAGALEPEPMLLMRSVHEFAATLALHPRETAVLFALARGVARAGLPAELGLSSNTVKTHVRALLRRTQHESVGDLVRTLLRRAHYGRD